MGGGEREREKEGKEKYEARNSFWSGGSIGKFLCISVQYHNVNALLTMTSLMTLTLGKNSKSICAALLRAVIDVVFISLCMSWLFFLITNIITAKRDKG